MNRSIQNAYTETILNTYTRQPVCIVRGSGSQLTDSDGKTYLDFFPGYGVGVLGHCHPEITRIIRSQAETLVHLPNTFYHPNQAELAGLLSRLSGGGKCFFCNSGAEANEAAIKFARKYGSEQDRHEIITFRNSFHGRTYGSMTATAQEKFHTGFAPLLPGFRYADFNDLDSVRRAVNERTVAVLLEPVQGEGGIHVADTKFMEGLSALCRERNILLMVDEVQTGLGRTGRFFAYQWYGLTPDVITLAKGIGGGLPMGVMIARRELAEVFAPGMHASTFGGSPLVCAAACQVIRILERDKLVERVETVGPLLQDILEAMARKHPALIDRIEGRGLMWGVKLRGEGKEIVSRCLEKGLIINCTAGTVLRLLPAMNIGEDLIRRMSEILDGVLADLERETAS